MSSQILQILKEITSIFAYSTDNSQTLSKVVAILAKRLKCDVCSIYAYDEESKMLVLAATHGLNQEIIGKFRLRPGQGITGSAFEKNEVINIIDPEKDPRFVSALGSGEEKYKSILSCPLFVGGRKYGVINLQSSERALFSEELIELIRALSVQIANIIESSRIFDTLKINAQAESDSAKNSFSKKIIKGIPANEGLAIGRITLLERWIENSDLIQERHNSVSEELNILSNAVAQAKKETSRMAERALEMISEADASIFSVHLLFLEDQSIFSKINKYINDGLTAEFSVKKVCDEYTEKFDRMNSEIFREKSADLKDVMTHLIKLITKIKGHNYEIEKKVPEGDKRIIAAKELMPSDIIRIPVSNVAGYISERGGITAHFAILARALNIPAMMGVSELSEIKENDKVILDCYTGNIYINPDPETEKSFSEVLKSRTEKGIESDPEPAFTKDSKQIPVNANLSLISEVDLLKRSGADGIGLYRTEFLYMIRDYPPTEENQLKIYKRICEAFSGRTVTFRILDAGSDKPLSYLNFSREENPAMGVRGIRLLEANEILFRTQLSAILRAGLKTKTRILIPMVSSVSQIRKLKEIISSISSELSSKGIEYQKDYQIGIMLEIPSVVFDLENILPELDFASIGTNDLLQFFYASDRSNEKLTQISSFYDPSFLRFLHMIGQKFISAGKTLCVCGEIASDPMSIPLFIGAGVSELSVSAKKVASVKKIIRKISADEAQRHFTDCLKLKSSAEVIEKTKSFTE